MICGYGRFGRELTADLRPAGLDVTVIEPVVQAEPEPGVIVGDASEVGFWPGPISPSAVGLVAGTDNDTTNLSMLANARRHQPGLFLAARQNRPTSAALFEAMRVDALLVPTEVVAHEVYAQISTPLLWRFIHDMPARGRRVGGRSDPAAAASTAGASCRRCGRSSWTRTKLRRSAAGSPNAGSSWATCCAARRTGTVAAGGAAAAAPRGEAVLTPDAETVLTADDELLFAGPGSQRRELESTLVVDSTARVRAVRRTPSQQLGMAQAVPEATWVERCRRPRSREQPPRLTPGSSRLDTRGGVPARVGREAATVGIRVGAVPAPSSTVRLRRPA